MLPLGRLACLASCRVFVQEAPHVSHAQDMPAGGVAAKATAAFPSLATALAHPWRQLRARWTHKLVYVLRGAACCICQRVEPLHCQCMSDWPNAP